MRRNLNRFSAKYVLSNHYLHIFFLLSAGIFLRPYGTSFMEGTYFPGVETPGYIPSSLRDFHIALPVLYRLSEMGLLLTFFEVLQQFHHKRSALYQAFTGMPPVRSISFLLLRHRSHKALPLFSQQEPLPFRQLDLWNTWKA